MRSKNLLLCCLFCLGVSTGAVGQDTLTIMTYNIYHGENPAMPGKSTVREIGRFIADQNPDFVALQEIDSATTRLSEVNTGCSFGLADSLAKLTDMEAYFGKAINFQGGGYGIAILSKRPVKVKKIKLPNPEEGEPRLLLKGRAKTESGHSLIFAATHLDHQYKRNRLTQIEAINKTFSESSRPVILAGDFNFSPDSEGYTAMQEKWQDAATESAVDMAGLTYPTANPEKRIDYIWLSKRDNWKIIDYETPDIDLSDHLPVVAKVVLYPKD